MALRLVRESSETPNVTNKDDVRMIRYAYGGYDGVVEGYGNELNYPKDDPSVFKILDGRVVLHGWEVDVDGAGWSFSVSDMTSGSYFYSVYLEVNAALETAEIRVIMDTADYPAIPEGDDLTAIPNGTATLLLYQITSNNGIVSSTRKVVPTIFYTASRIASLEDTTDKLRKDLDASDYQFSTNFAELDVELRIKFSEIDGRLTRLGFSNGNIIYMDYTALLYNAFKTNVPIGYVAKLGKVIYGYIDLRSISDGIASVSQIYSSFITSNPPKTGNIGFITPSSKVSVGGTTYQHILYIQINQNTGVMSGNSIAVDNPDLRNIPVTVGYFAYSTDGEHEPK